MQQAKALKTREQSVTDLDPRMPTLGALGIWTWRVLWGLFNLQSPSPIEKIASADKSEASKFKWTDALQADPSLLARMM